MNIAVGTCSILKIKGIEQAFRKFFPEEKINIFPYDVNSNVPSQPICLTELEQGCENRISETRKVRGKEKTDYFIGVESGLVENRNIQMVKIVKSDGMETWGQSSGFQIPDELLEEVRKTSLKEVMDKEFGGKGGISYLSKGIYSRSKLVEEAIIMALSGMMWKEMLK